MGGVGRASNATLRKRKILTHTWHHTRSFLFHSHNTPGGKNCYYPHFIDENIEALGHIAGGHIA